MPDLIRDGKMLKATATALAIVLAFRFDAQRRSLQHFVDVTLCIFGSNPGIVKQHLFSRQCAVDKHDALINMSDTATVMGERFDDGCGGCGWKFVTPGHRYFISVNSGVGHVNGPCLQVYEPDPILKV